MNKEIKEQLVMLKCEKYGEFQRRILPHVNNIIGVRTPALRKLAKQIMKEDYLNYLENACDDSYEEVLLQGMVIGYSKLSLTEIKPYIINYIPKITNWALCDLFVGGLKITKENKVEMYDFIQPYLTNDQTYDIRFGIVMLLNYYLEEEYCERVFAYFNKITSQEYYVQMAIAWALSMYYVNYKEKTMKYLLNNQLDDFTYNKALQKIVESLQIEKDEKVIIKSMKRKKSIRKPLPKG